MENVCLLHSMCSNYFMFLIHLSLLQRVRHKEGRKKSGKFLAGWIKRDLGIKTAVKTNMRHSKLYITNCNLIIIVNDWPWECWTLSVIKLLKCKKCYSNKVFSWLPKMCFTGLPCEMHNNMHLPISLLIYLGSLCSMKIWVKQIICCKTIIKQT